MPIRPAPGRVPSYMDAVYHSVVPIVHKIIGYCVALPEFFTKHSAGRTIATSASICATIRILP